jgi:N4-gp56 family major capsid protein
MAAVGLDSGVTNLSGTSQLSPEVMTYYEKVFLHRAEYELILKEGSQQRTHPVNSGQTVNFTRYTPLTIITDPLGEASNPVTCAITACTVSMTLSEYGLTVNTSKLLSLISIDSNLKEKIELVGQNMGETINRLTRAELQNGTSYYGNDHAVTSFAAGDTLDACDIRMIVRDLELNKAMKYKDGFYVGKTDPYSKINLMADTAWLNAKTYSDVKDLYRGEMGELLGVRWLLNKDVSSGTEATSVAASAVVRFYTYVHGDNAFGTYDLAQDKPKLYIVPNAVDSNSPAGRISIISWAGSYATKVLNSDWVMTCRFSAT